MSASLVVGDLGSVEPCAGQVLGCQPPHLGHRLAADGPEAGEIREFRRCDRAAGPLRQQFVGVRFDVVDRDPASGTGTLDRRDVGPDLAREAAYRRRGRDCGQTFARRRGRWGSGSFGRGLLLLFSSAPLLLRASAPLLLRASAPPLLCPSAPLLLRASAPLLLCPTAPLLLCGDFRIRCLSGVAGGLGSRVDGSDRGVFADGVALGDVQLDDLAGSGGRHFDRRFFGLDLDQALVFFDLVADGHEHRHHVDAVHAFAQFREFDGDCHDRLLRPSPGSARRGRSRNRR